MDCKIQTHTHTMPRVSVVNHGDISDKPFDIERSDLPYHNDIDEYNLRVQLTMYCEEDGDTVVDTHTIYPSYEQTPTHTHQLTVSFTLIEFPAGAVGTVPVIGWVQNVSYTELRHTIGGLTLKCGEEMILAMNRVANTDATHLFSNRYDEQTLMPRCLHFIGKEWGDVGDAREEHNRMVVL